MTVLQAALLGIVQGLTEFLPISSSAHLVLVPYALGWNFPQSEIFPFDVLVQMGTLLAVIVYFWRDLWGILREFFTAIARGHPFATEQARLGWYLIIGTIPAGVLGLLIQKTVEQTFQDPVYSGYFLLVTALLLVIAEWAGKKNRPLESVGALDALWVGCFQAISLFPGISRSGATMTGGMTRHLERPAAARFSFLLAVPVMLGAGVVSLKDLFAVPQLGSFLPELLVGVVVAALTGFLAIRWLLGFIQRHSFYGFAAYCAVIGLAAIALISLRGPAQGAAQAAALPAPVQVWVDPALEWATPAVNRCALQENLPVQRTWEPPAGSASAAASPAARIDLSWGQPAASSAYTYQLGSDRLVLAAGETNPLAQIDTVTLQALSRGVFPTWGKLFASCTSCASGTLAGEWSSRPLTPWAYPAGSSWAGLIQAKTGLSGLASSAARVAPTPAAMQQELSADAGAIGFLPARWLSPGLREVKLSDVPTESLAVPILASLSGEPQGTLRSWLACLQNALG